ncbi:N-acetylneuraminate synthase family protein [bacterium]|nr:N-acetylneuraminate synthase family protein [bacterium]
MNKRIRLAKGRYVGENEVCFITVDVGANHNRDLKVAKELIDKATEAGADAIKFQIYSAETLYSKHVPRHSYYKKHLWDLIKEIETPREWIPKLKDYCDRKHIIFFATPFDIEAVDQLASYVDFYKIASFELVDLQLIEYTAKKKKPLIISTGLANMEEIKDAYLTCKKAGNGEIIFMQCASLYPAKPEIMNLKAIHTIKTAFPDTVVGLSDHTPGIHISLSAVAMGAKVIEKHLTLSRKMEGPDHSFAIEPDELKEMVRQVREIESALGDGKKLGPNPEEMENYQIARSSIHAKVKILKGTRITKEMLIIKRPAYGIKPKFIDMIIGRKARKDIKEDEWITWELAENDKS